MYVLMFNAFSLVQDTKELCYRNELEDLELLRCPISYLQQHKGPTCTVSKVNVVQRTNF